LKELQSGARITLQKTDVDRDMFDTILDLDMSDEDTDTTVNRYLSSGNRNNYNTLRGAGQSPEKSIEILKGIDTDEKGTISQKEMWAYYKAHPEDEAAIEALFNAQGYTGKTTKNWATFKKAKH
jgi:Ca2+-binding EF-hand superfamily protein